MKVMLLPLILSALLLGLYLFTDLTASCCRRNVFNYYKQLGQPYCVTSLHFTGEVASDGVECWTKSYGYSRDPDCIVDGDIFSVQAGGSSNGSNSYYGWCGTKYRYVGLYK